MQKRILELIPIAIVVVILTVACSGAATTAPPADTTIPPTVVPPTNTPVPPTNTPVPTDTPIPAAAGGGDCVIGTWTVSNMQEYMESVMGSALVSTPGNFTFVSQTGEALINFGADGHATMNANDFALNFTIDVSGISLDMAVTMDGTSSSDFVVDSPQITFTNSDTGDMSLVVTIGGTETVSSSELASFFGEPDTTSMFTYECQGNTMLYTPPIENAIPLTLTRVG